MRICAVYDGSYVEWCLKKTHTASAKRFHLEFKNIHATICSLLAKACALSPDRVRIIDAHYFRSVGSNQKGELSRDRTDAWSVEQAAASAGVAVHFSKLVDGVEKDLDSMLIAQSLESLMTSRCDALVLVTGDLTFVPLLESVRQMGLLSILVWPPGCLPKGKRPEVRLLSSALNDAADSVLELRIVGERAEGVWLRPPPRIQRSRPGEITPPGKSSHSPSPEPQSDLRCWKKGLIEAARLCESQMKRDREKGRKRDQLEYCQDFMKRWRFEKKPGYTPEKLSNYMSSMRREDKL